MIEYRTGSLFDSHAEALVNPVNLVGVMGKGLALEFKRRFPGLFEAYRLHLRTGELGAGRVSAWSTGLDSPLRVYLFASKRHWREGSRLEDIALGLPSLAERVRMDGVKSVAVPALGCGLGGLEWAEVRPLLEEHLGSLTARCLIHPPKPED